MKRSHGLLMQDLVEAVPGGLRDRAIDRLGMAHDASHYLLKPEAVVVPSNADQVAALLRVSAEHGIPLTFRSGGTSLSGQAVTEHLLVDTRSKFRDIEVLDNGARVRVQPGATLRQVNNRLARYGRKLGPDPASEIACTIGGVVANNSSGMTCGTELNSYRTLESLLLVLPSGTVVDTGAADADERLRALEPELFDGLLRLRDRVRGNADSLRRIEAQFAMKNTMGYGVNSFVDFDTPAELLGHLVVGSEGTLAFVARATFRTVPALPHAATGLLVFPSLSSAMASMPDILAAAPAAVELLDSSALRVAQRDTRASGTLRSMQVADHAALLMEWQAVGRAELDEQVRVSAPMIDQLQVSAPAALTRDAAARAGLWHIRKGLYATIAAARPPGTTALLEDVAVPVAELAATCAELSELFNRHEYTGSVIFGHAKDGNLHFMLTERFSPTVAPTRYAAFTEDMVDVILARGGTLKAEHGTGRVMAPYVRRQFGDELYAVMRDVKTLCDPNGTLNPGVLLSDDAELHLRDLKTVPTVEPEVDRCVECGYCEPVCPSADLTTTPRQRIVLRREIAAAQAAGDAALARELSDDYDYDAVQTCAVDGMCATACPVLINTGDLVKRLRTDAAAPAAGKAWRFAAGHWNAATRAMAWGLNAASAVPPVVPERVSAAARRVFSAEHVPQWQRDLPRGGKVRRAGPAPDADAVYLPSCLNTMFRPVDSGVGVMNAMLTLADRAGVRLHVPASVSSLCCGTPWSSKGMTSGYHEMGGRVRRALEAATDGGKLPLITDASSCAEGFQDQLESIVVLDASTYVATVLLPRLVVKRRLSSLALHPTCSSTRTGTNETLLAIARQIADEVVVPDEWRCCGFAGDRGMLHPELTASATAPEASALQSRAFDAYASVNRTCEIGMTRATGRPYQHLIELVEQATAPDQR